MRCRLLVILSLMLPVTIRAGDELRPEKVQAWLWQHVQAHRNAEALIIMSAQTDLRLAYRYDRALAGAVQTGDERQRRRRPLSHECRGCQRQQHQSSQHRPCSNPLVHPSLRRRPHAVITSISSL